MKAPNLTDRVVDVRAYLTDDTFGYDHWRAAQVCAPSDGKPALLLIFDSAEACAEAKRRVIQDQTPFSAPKDLTMTSPVEDVIDRAPFDDIIDRYLHAAINVAYVACCAGGLREDTCARKAVFDVRARLDAMRTTPVPIVTASGTVGTRHGSLLRGEDAGAWRPEDEV